MEISGKVSKILELQSGEGKNGVWKKQEFVIEIPGSFPKIVCLQLWGEKITQYPFELGDDVTVSFDLESREYNGKYYTDAKAWKVVKNRSAGESVPPPASEDLLPDIPGGDTTDFSLTDNADDSDLPF